MCRIVRGAVCGFATGRADAVEIEPVARWKKIVLPGEVFLQAFDFRAEKFNGPAAMFTNEVIVMSSGVQAAFETGHAVSEVHFTGQTRIAQQLESAIHGCLTDGRVPSASCL